MECELADDSFSAPVSQSVLGDEARSKDEEVERSNWYCDICGDGPRSSQDDDCLGCAHQSCATCHSESKEGFLLQRTTPASSRPTESNDVRSTIHQDRDPQTENSNIRTLVDQPLIATSAEYLTWNIHRHHRSSTGGVHLEMSRARSFVKKTRSFFWGELILIGILEPSLAPDLVRLRWR